jgi:aminodeoxyfutalosine synthase
MSESPVDRSTHLALRAAARARLSDVAERVIEGRRLSREDGLRLYGCSDLAAVGALANVARERASGDRTYYVRNQHVNYTNVCNKGCRFCAFQVQPKDPRGYVLSIDDIRERMRRHLDQPITEVHVVAGINPKLPFQYYLDLIAAIKEIRPSVCLKAFTMIELHQIARVAKMGLAETVRALKAAGLDAVPGGGAEVFSDDMHEELFKAKLSSDEWCDVARAVHGEGLRSNATLLYGIGETIDQKVAHLVRLRELQDETHGLLCFIPLAFHPANTELAHLPAPTGAQNLREIALARLMLDNVEHVKAYWIMISPEIAQVALWYGADDVDGSVLREEIVHEAGAVTPQELQIQELRRRISEAGRIPIERDALYREIPAASEPAAAQAIA